jgi:hypothetical protein
VESTVVAGDGDGDDAAVESTVVAGDGDDADAAEVGIAVECEDENNEDLGGTEDCDGTLAKGFSI